MKVQENRAGGCSIPTPNRAEKPPDVGRPLSITDRTELEAQTSNVEVVIRRTMRLTPTMQPPMGCYVTELQATFPVTPAAALVPSPRPRQMGGLPSTLTWRTWCRTCTPKVRAYIRTSIRRFLLAECLLPWFLGASYPMGVSILGLLGIRVSKNGFQTTDNVVRRSLRTLPQVSHLQSTDLGRLIYNFGFSKG